MKVVIYDYEVEMDPNARIRKNFKLYELANNKGSAELPQFIINADVDLFLDMIQELRNWWAKSMTVNSCFRQAAYNKSVGGSSNSLHLKALALDWGVKLTDAQRSKLRDKWADICQAHGRIGGINYYSWGVHLDAFEDNFGYKSFVVRDYR